MQELDARLKVGVPAMPGPWTVMESCLRGPGKFSRDRCLEAPEQCTRQNCMGTEWFSGDRSPLCFEVCDARSSLPFCWKKVVRSDGSCQDTVAAVQSNTAADLGAFADLDAVCYYGDHVSTLHRRNAGIAFVINKRHSALGTGLLRAISDSSQLLRKSRPRKSQRSGRQRIGTAHPQIQS